MTTLDKISSTNVLELNLVFYTLHTIQIYVNANATSWLKGKDINNELKSDERKHNNKNPGHRNQGGTGSPFSHKFVCKVPLFSLQKVPFCLKGCPWMHVPPTYWVLPMSLLKMLYKPLLKNGEGQVYLFILKHHDWKAKEFLYIYIHMLWIK